MTNITPIRRPEPEPDSFDAFWRAYPSPRRVGKVLAKVKWDAITSAGGLSTRILDKDSGEYVPVELRATPEEIIEGVKRYDAAMRLPGVGEYGYKDGGKFICLPSTYLNQGRWMD